MPNGEGIPPEDEVSPGEQYLKDLILGKQDEPRLQGEPSYEPVTAPTAPKRPSLWQEIVHTVAPPLFKGLEYALEPFAWVGQAFAAPFIETPEIKAETEHRKAERFAALGRVPYTPPKTEAARKTEISAFRSYRQSGGKLSTDQWRWAGMPATPKEELEPISKEIESTIHEQSAREAREALSLGGILRKEYEKLAWWQQILFELPAWLAIPSAGATSAWLRGGGTAGKVLAKTLKPAVWVEELPGRVISGIRARVFKPKMPKLPEPKEYLGALRVHHPERFKTKTDVDAIFKDIRQYNLLIREIASNTPQPVMAGLVRQGRSVDLFKLKRISPDLYDMTVRAPYIKPKAKGASMAISDVMSKPTAYEWIGKEGKRALAFARAYRKIEQELFRFEKAHGIPIKERFYPAGEYHIGRNVIAEIDQQGNVIVQRVLRRGRLGTKLSAERERFYTTQAEGIAAGKVYALPEESMQFRIQSAIDRAGGLKIKGEYIDLLSATPKQMMDMNVKEQWQALSNNYKGAIYVGKALQRVKRGETLPPATMKAISKRNPKLAKELDAIIKGEIKPRVTTLNKLIKSNRATTQGAKVELREFAPIYHRATARAREQAFSEGRIWGFPAMQNRVFGDVVNPHNPSEVLMSGREVVTKLNEIFGAERVDKMVSTASDFSRAGVSVVAAMDGSWPFIQGPMVLGHDASMWIRGKPSAVWFKSTFEMFKTMVNPKWFADFQIRHAATYTEAPLIIRTPSEFVSGFGVLERWASKVPKVGGVLTRIIRETYGRAGAGFSGAAEASRILGYETMKKTWVKHGGDLTELQVLMNQLSGAVSLRYLGVSAQETARESALLFAPSFTRAWLMNIRDLLRGTMKAREVQASMAGMFVTMIGSYIALCTALGKEPKLNPAPISVGGDGAQFLSIEIKGVNVGAPGWGYSLLRLAANIAAVAATNPEALIKLDMANPILRAVFSKSSPLVSLAKETATQRDFFGNRLETGKDWVLMLVDKVIPIAAQSILEKTPESDVWTAVGAELFGVRTYPVQPYERLARMREDLACEYLDQEGDPYLWDELPNMLKDEIRRNNPEFEELEKQIQEDWALKRGTDGERTVYLVKQEIEKEFIEQLDDLTTKLKVGQIAPDEYRRRVGDVRGERSIQKDLLWRLYEIGEPEEAADYDRYMRLEAPIEDRYMHLYWEYQDALVKALGAGADWGVINTALDAWLNSIHPYYKDYIVKYKDNWIKELPLEIQGVIKPMTEARDYIQKSGYWDYDYETPEGRQARLDMRTRDATLDAYLILWYGPEAPRSETATQMLGQITEELGIPAFTPQTELTPSVITEQSLEQIILGQ